MNKSGLQEKVYLVLDIGTSDIKCGLIDPNYNILAQYSRKFPLLQNQRSIEIDFDLFFNTTNELLIECLANQNGERSRVEALLITSQAQTFAPVNAAFVPIYNGIVWLDERAQKEAAFLKDRLSDFVQSAGFNQPLSSLYISKLLWLKNNEPAVFKKARAFPLINEYLALKLTGKFYSDSTNFGMGGIYDFRRNAINTDVLQILGLTEDFFPKIDNAAGRSEFISRQNQLMWGIDYRFPVYLCGNDQGASACGAGLKHEGDVSINFGTAMVFYTITEAINKNLNKDQIAGKHPVGQYYFLLNYENDFGIQIRQLKDKFFKQGTYDQFFQTYNEYPDVDKQNPFSEETDLNFVLEADAHRYCAGVIKYYLHRFRSHFSQIRKSVLLKNITISGGMTLSEVWLKILRTTLDQPFTINNRANAGLIGALYIYLNNYKGKICDD